MRNINICICYSHWGFPKVLQTPSLTGCSMLSVCSARRCYLIYINAPNSLFEPVAIIILLGKVNLFQAWGLWSRWQSWQMLVSVESTTLFVWNRIYSKALCDFVLFSLRILWDEKVDVPWKYLSWLLLTMLLFMTTLTSIMSVKLTHPVFIWLCLEMMLGEA